MSLDTLNDDSAATEIGRLWAEALTLADDCLNLIKSDRASLGGVTIAAYTGDNYDIRTVVTATVLLSVDSNPREWEYACNVQSEGRNFAVVRVMVSEYVRLPGGRRSVLG